jgi:hypothetical protein
LLAPQHLLPGLGAVREDMEAVGDLDGLRSAAGGAFGEVRPAVAAYRPDLRPVLEPGGAGISRALGQQIHDPVALEVDQDGAVGLAAAQAPIVDTDHGASGRGRHRSPPNLPHEGIRAGGPAEHRQEPGSRSTADREADRTRPGDKPLGASCLGSEEAGKALGEDVAGAGRLVTEEPADGQLEMKGHAMPRYVGDRAGVTRMPSGGPVPADATARPRGVRPHDRGDPPLRRGQPDQPQLRGVRAESYPPTGRP